MRVLLLIVICLAAGACATPADRSVRALEAVGMTDIQLTGVSPFGCGENEFWARKFSARNVKGQTVTGVVCGSWMKGATVRFD